MDNETIAKGVESVMRGRGFFVGVEHIGCDTLEFVFTPQNASEIYFPPVVYANILAGVTPEQYADEAEKKLDTWTSRANKHRA